MERRDDMLSTTECTEYISMITHFSKPQRARFNPNYKANKYLHVCNVCNQSSSSPLTDDVK